MNLKDIGPQPQSFDREQATRDNKKVRTVVRSGCYLQVTLMSIPARSDIGLEMHAERPTHVSCLRVCQALSGPPR